MKTEDIDKRIGMPDVNTEWTKFEREVIGNSPAGGKPKAKQSSCAALSAMPRMSCAPR